MAKMVKVSNIADSSWLNMIVQDDLMMVGESQEVDG